MKNISQSVLLAIAFSLIVGCSPSKPVPVEKADKKFTVYHIENSKGVPLFANRNFGKLFIFSSATNFEERAQTCLFVAKEYLEQEDLQYVKVFHLPYGHEALVGAGHYIAVAEYAPDGKGADGKSTFANGTWQASAVEGEVDSVDAMILVLWNQMREQHMKSDSSVTYVDEPSLKQAISEAIGGRLTADEIALPFYNLKEYNN